MKILIAGDFSPKYGEVNELIRTKTLKPFESLIPIIQSADISIVNFESTINCPTALPLSKCGPNLKCAEESIELLAKAGFDVLTLANNHILDYGREGLEKTIATIKQSNLNYVGAGKDLESARQPLYITKDQQTIGIINSCEHEFSIASDTTPGANPLDIISISKTIIECKKKADYVIVITHGGIENYQLPSLEMQKRYRFFIDMGADVVVNHHQHCYSGYEIYHQKPIFYGLGNFFFNKKIIGNATNWNEGYMVYLDLNQINDFKLIPYLQTVSEYRIELLENKTPFYNEINKLNSIIGDRDKLQEENKKYFVSKSREVLSMFYPLQNKYLKAAYRKGLIPGWFAKKYLLYVLNHIECEAHREELIAVLKQRL